VFVTCDLIRVFIVLVFVFQDSVRTAQ
jgi:hypothetical protein